MNIYQENGYEDRADYLEALSDASGMPLEDVQLLADTLGACDDFDALVGYLEDYAGDM